MSSPQDTRPTAEEGGVSLIRDDEATALLRRRLERPARLGLYVLALPGAVAEAAGIALFLTSPSLLGVAVALFGGVLIVLGVVQFLLLQSDLAHWPDRVFLWEGGIELVLHNGEVRGVAWTDPDLALGLVARRAPPPAGREFLLVWMSEGRIPSIELSAEGFTRLRKAAEDHRLAVTEQRRGRASDGAQWIEIHPNRAALLATSTRESGEAVAP
ncbi:MAG: hypothetical protein L3J68_04615 [Thermoplasmata archaeon]|nr:hypothetical protein [Thermoplasmata archaeon]